MFFRNFLSIMILIAISACSSGYDRGVSIKFILKYQDDLISCKDLSKSNFTLEDFRFYVFQNENEVQLLDFISNGQCRTKLELRNWQISKNNSNNISFKLGVPNVLNHQNPVKANPPLNQSAMHWQWLSGYKFLRLEYEKQERLNRFHLGSWGCSGKIPDAVKCKQTNIINVSLDDFIANESVIEIHLDSLIDVQAESLCMGDPTELACKNWIDALRNDVFSVGYILQ